MQKKEILKIGETTAKKVSIIVFLLASLKALIAFISGSIVLLSDALHSVADAFEILFIWLGFKISQRKPTEKFPYGFYKAESISALVVSLLILFAGYQIAQESYERIFSSYDLKLPQIAVAVAILDAILIYLLGRYEVKIGQAINSQSLIADGKESKLHIISSSLVVLGILSSYFGFLGIEGIAGLLLSLFIFKIGIESTRDSVFSLMDVSPSKEIEKEIKTILESVESVKDFSGLRLRKSGPFIFGEVNIKIKKFVAVERAHEISDKIEKDVKAKVPQIDSFAIHVEPFSPFEQKIIIPTKEKNNLESQIDERFARAEFFAILKVKKDKIESFEFKENIFKEKEIRAGLAVAKYLLEQKPDVLIVRQIGPISFHTLRDNLIEVYKAEQGTIRQIIKDFSENQLVKLEKPTKEKE
ncbi:MAG: cation diffusion facilitator family transporter [Candidatus Nealsonbacteria bacterium]|nr:MAG: cation diffusion facilitator family transporter [Candidatus Nealsonbacteria bacterium]